MNHPFFPKKTLVIKSYLHMMTISEDPPLKIINTLI